MNATCIRSSGNQQLLESAGWLWRYSRSGGGRYGLRGAGRSDAVWQWRRGLSVLTTGPPVRVKNKGTHIRSLENQELMYPDSWLWRYKDCSGVAVRPPIPSPSDFTRCITSTHVIDPGIGPNEAPRCDDSKTSIIAATAGVVVELFTYQ